MITKRQTVPEPLSATLPQPQSKLSTSTFFPPQEAPHLVPLIHIQHPTCQDHAMPITHICKDPKCAYVFLCSECFVRNERHLQEHQKQIQSWSWVGEKFKKELGSQLGNSLRELKVNLQNLYNSAPKDFQRIKNKITQIFEQCRTRFVAQSHVIQNLYLDTVDSQAHLILNSLKKYGLEVLKLEENVQRHSNSIKQSYQDILNNQNQKSAMLRLKKLIKKALIEEADYSGFQQQFNNLQQNQKSMRMLINNNLRLNVALIENCQFPVKENQVITSQSSKLNKVKKDIRRSITNARITVEPSLKAKNLYHIKTNLIPHKPTGIYNLTSQKNISILIKYRAGENVFGLTQALNFYIKNEEHQNLQLSFIDQFKLNGRIFSYSQQHIFIGTKEGSVRIINRLSKNITTIKASKHRVSSVFYCKNFDFLLIGSQNGSISIWASSTQDYYELVKKFPSVIHSKVYGLSTIGKYMVSVGNNQIILTDLPKLQTIASIGHDLIFNDSSPPMNNSLVTLDDQQNGIIMLAANGDKRVALFYMNP